MSYLEFLIKKIFAMNKESEDKLRWLIKLCMDEDYVAFVDNKIYICEQDTTIKAIIRPKEFDDISKIIQSQNDPCIIFCPMYISLSLQASYINSNSR
jgi:hypothetical protein